LGLIQAMGSGCQALAAMPRPEIKHENLTVRLQALRADPGSEDRRPRLG
jgi:hypothetical protein